MEHDLLDYLDEPYRSVAREFLELHDATNTVFWIKKKDNGFRLIWGQNEAFFDYTEFPSCGLLPPEWMLQASNQREDTVAYMDGDMPLRKSLDFTAFVKQFEPDDIVLYRIMHTPKAKFDQYPEWLREAAQAEHARLESPTEESWLLKVCREVRKEFDELPEWIKEASRIEIARRRQEAAEVYKH